MGFLRSEGSRHAEAYAAAIRYHQQEVAKDATHAVGAIGASAGARRQALPRLSTTRAVPGYGWGAHDEEAQALIDDLQPSSVEADGSTLSLSERARQAYMRLAARAAGRRRRLAQRASEAAISLAARALAVRTCIARLRAVFLCESQQVPTDDKSVTSALKQAKDGHIRANAMLRRSLCFSLAIHACALLAVSLCYLLVIWWYSHNGVCAVCLSLLTELRLGGY